MSEQKLSDALKILSEANLVVESTINSDEAEKLYTLAFSTLLLADRVHTWHWACKSGFHHTHFQTIYESLRDFADELVEITLSSGKDFEYNIPESIVPTKLIPQKSEFDEKRAIEILEEFVEELEKMSDIVDEKGFKAVVDLVDGEIGTLTKEIGLLKSFS